MRTRTYMTGIVSLMVNAVLFGTGAIIVLAVPELRERAIYLIPAVVLASIVIAPFIAWKIAPKMRARNWNRHEGAST